MSAITNNTDFKGEGLLALTKKASAEDDNFGLLALTKEASVDENFGLLALTKEASIESEDRPATSLMKQANGDAIAHMVEKKKKEKRQKKAKKSKKQERDLMQHVPAHLAREIPFLSTAYGAYKGQQEGVPIRGAILGAHGVQGIKDKREGKGTKNRDDIGLSGFATGAVTGAAINERDFRKKNKATQAAMRQQGLPVLDLPNSPKLMARRLGGSAFMGGAIGAGLGGIGYGLGRLSEPRKEKKAA